MVKYYRGLKKQNSINCTVTAAATIFPLKYEINPNSKIYLIFDSDTIWADGRALIV